MRMGSAGGENGRENKVRFLIWRQKKGLRELEVVEPGKTLNL